MPRPDICTWIRFFFRKYAHVHGLIVFFSASPSVFFSHPSSHDALTHREREGERMAWSAVDLALGNTPKHNCPNEHVMSKRSGVHNFRTKNNIYDYQSYMRMHVGTVFPVVLGNFFPLPSSNTCICAVHRRKTDMNLDDICCAMLNARRQTD